MNYDKAYTYTAWLLEYIRPACEIAEIGGSLRRKKTEVHDAEIVCKPSTTIPRTEFGQKIYKTTLDRVLENMEFDGTLYKVKGADKMKQYRTGRWTEFGYQAPLNPFMFELWICTPPASWGVQYMIRTGPAEFSQYMVTQKSKGGALPDKYHVRQGTVWEDNQRIEIPTEQDYFALCGMRYIEPEKRIAAWARP